MNIENEQLIEKLVRDEATKGMVRAKLRKLGVDGAEFEACYSRIKNRHTSNVRSKGAFNFLAGLALVFAGSVLLYFAKERGSGGGRGGIFMIGGGALFAIKGLVTVVSGVKE